MMYKMVLSNEAINDLKDTKAYISRELKNPMAARRIVAGISKRLRILETYPEAGPSVAALTGEDTDIRLLSCDKHIAMYRIIGNTIHVARIVNARQDYMRLILGIEYE